MDNLEDVGVLLVDDDEEIRHALRLLFEFDDFAVVGEASNGLDAIALAVRHQPAFVLLDFEMPGMAGDKVAEVIRSVSPITRIVAFSAYLAAKPEWADAFLNKDRIAQVAPLLERLVARRLRTSRVPVTAARS
ncbi:MAG: response regulator [Actinomycetota bacterium]|nr:response regulator [Actinomycetota bacterium]